MEEKKEITTENNSKPQFAIFDWIVSLPIIRIVKPLYEWKKAFWIYCFLGFLSTGINYVFAIVFAETLPIPAFVANLLAWVLQTLISFVLFRYFYFDRTDNSFFNELIKYASARVFTLGVETLTVYIFVDLLFPGTDRDLKMKITKAVLIPVTAILNYFISKLFVFKNKKEKVA